MPIEPDELNKIGKKVDITRLTQKLVENSYAKGKIPNLSPQEWKAITELARNQKGYRGAYSGSGFEARGKKQVDITRLIEASAIRNVNDEEWVKLTKLSRQLEGFRGMKTGSGSQLSAYGKWANTPPNMASELANRIEPLPENWKNRETWWGAGGERNTSSLYISPTRIVDRIARDLASGRMSPADLISKGIKYYPRGTRFYGFDDQGNPIKKENAPYALKALMGPNVTAPNLRKTVQYLENVMDVPEQKGKPSTPIKPPAPPKKPAFRGPWLRPILPGIKDI